jgi:hypothetical protein
MRESEIDLHDDSRGSLDEETGNSHGYRRGYPCGGEGKRDVTARDGITRQLEPIKTILQVEGKRDATRVC